MTIEELWKHRKYALIVGIVTTILMTGMTTYAVCEKGFFSAIGAMSFLWQISANIPLILLARRVDQDIANKVGEALAGGE